MIIWEIIDLNIRMGKFVVWYLHTYLYIGTTCRMLARCHKKPSESVNQRGAPQLSLCKSCFKTGSWRIQRPLYWPSFPILNSFHEGASSELAQYTKELKKVEIEVMKMISSKAKTIWNFKRTNFSFLHLAYLFGVGNRPRIDTNWFTQKLKCINIVIGTIFNIFSPLWSAGMAKDKVWPEKRKSQKLHHKYTHIHKNGTFIAFEVVARGKLKSNFRV